MGDMTPEEVRRLALALPEATEAPHHDRTSFRVAGKIFATLPPDGATLNVLLDEEEARASADEAPGVVELLWWGKRLSGVQVALEQADAELVRGLLEDAYRRRAPRG
jgi:hypothetical protein